MQLIATWSHDKLAGAADGLAAGVAESGDEAVFQELLRYHKVVLQQRRGNGGQDAAEVGKFPVLGFRIFFQ